MIVNLLSNQKSNGYDFMLILWRQVTVVIQCGTAKHKAECNSYETSRWPSFDF